MTKRFYLTTAIDYANGDPHIGHAFEKIGADAIARYHRLRGADVFFLAGLDEHGQKVAQSAAAGGVSPQQFVDDIARRFTTRWAELAISYDEFIRTTQPAHKAGVVALIERIHQRRPDDFYEQSYEGWYCVGCELFKRETEIADGHCVLHPTRELQWTKERNWFFRLSRYQAEIQALIDRPGFVRPESRRNEMLGLLASGLEDISITRSRLSWAVPFPIPISSGESQGTWVWFDALPNYLTATGFPAAHDRPRWPAQLHIVGKDINRLHTIVWPAMLLAADLPLPESVWVHGFVNFAGERLSKSAGATVDLESAVGRHGPDALRYYLLREFPFGGDGDFSWERFDERYEADLANAWGNLSSRVIAMVERYRGGVVPSPGSLDASDDASDIAAYHAAMDGSRGYLLHDGAAAVGRMVARANERVQRTTPWTLAKDPARAGELDAVLHDLIARIARTTLLYSPFMPAKCAEIWKQLGAPGNVTDQRLDALESLDPAGWRVTKGDPLFPKKEKVQS